MYRILEGKGISIAAFGTTGSGRRLVGELFGADSIVNEITAHGTGTGTYFPDVETIFEIGGQDAKYIRLERGLVADVNMNYVCAAGTGSFVEEQARKLGFTLDQIGPATEHIAPPVTSDRCTVFMEQDLRAILKRGFSKEEALAAVLYSVIQNYLTKVVGNRHISRKKVFFQGATARNKGLVAAFENLLNVEVVVSPFCHVMGSIGAAIIALDDAKSEGTAFIGERAITLETKARTEVCNLCANVCRINFIQRTDDGREFSWGYMCGREPGEETRKDIPQYHAFRERTKLFYSRNEVVGTPKGNIVIPHTLVNHTFYPLWQRFFNLLGFSTSLSAPATLPEIKELSSKFATGDFCFPAKASIGHVIAAMKRNEPIFHPFYIADKDQLDTAMSFYCPYVEANPAVTRSLIERTQTGVLTYVTPVIDFRLSPELNGRELAESLEKVFKINKKEIVKAYTQAFNDWTIRMRTIREKGESLLKEKQASGKPVFVIVGRPYNIHDKGANLGIPETIASMGYDVIPIDMLELDTAALADSNYYNVFWNYGQKIIAAIKRIRKTQNLFPIYLSNFNCGPDSFLLSYAEEEMKGKPMLILELDEHDSDGGYRTRIEAFLDVVKSYRKRTAADVAGAPVPMPDAYTPKRNISSEGRIIWFPPMHAFTARTFAACFRAWNYDARALPLEDEEALLLGKKHTRGGECLPMTATLGAILKQVKNSPKHEKHMFFMPTAEGPCRFGQYNLLERLVFHNESIDNIEIMSPSSVNSYQGIPEDLRRYMMHGVMTGDILHKLGTKIRPYELTAGDTDELLERKIRQVEAILEKKGDPRKVLPQIVDEFAAIPRTHEQKPLVGIVGEIYVRCNDFTNDDLVRVIEKNGGEAWLSPISEWILYTAQMQSYFSRKHGFKLFEAGESLLKNLYLFQMEKSYLKLTDRLLKDRHEPDIKDVIEEGARFVPREFCGETILTLGRAIMFAKQGARMVINAAPFGCMPGTITSSIFLEIKDSLNIPILSQFYDGDIKVNDKVAALLKTITLSDAKENELLEGDPLNSNPQN